MVSGIDPAAIATEVKLGRMLKENAPTKAMRYLVEGRCIVRHVDDDRVLARVRGREVYDVEHQAGRGWSCNCLARGRCAHILAVSHVVARLTSDRGGPVASRADARPGHTSASYVKKHRS